MLASDRKALRFVLIDWFGEKKWGIEELRQREVTEWEGRERERERERECERERDRERQRERQREKEHLKVHTHTPCKTCSFRAEN